MKRILIIEDNEANLYLVSFILKKGGHEVLEARTGEEGVEVALNEKPDLILMDIQLPGIDGLETTRRVRESVPYDAIPIVALTSYAMAGDQEKALEAGCNGYIEKPIDPDTFTAKINEYLQKSRDAIHD